MSDRRLPPSLLSQPRSARGFARRARRRRTLAVVTVLAVVAVGIVASTVATHRLDPLVTAFGSISASGRGAAKESSTAPTATPPAERPIASAEPSAAEKAPQQTGAGDLVIGWVGDLTPGSKYGNPPRSGRALFEPTRKYTLKPDLMVANLEGTYGKGGTSKCDGRDSSVCFAFQAPPKNADALAWAGFDVVNLANNHSRDYLGAGVKSTKKALEKNGVAYTGLVDTVTVKEVDGVRVAFLGFSPYSWSPSIADLKKAKALVREADANADVVVVLMHAGAEGADKTRTPKGGETAFGEFRGNPRAFSHAVIDAGADLVLGSGPHVIRGMEEYKGRLVAYSLGNFGGWKNFGRSGKLALSGLLTVRLASDGRVLDGRWRSLRIAEPGVPRPDASHESARLVRKLSKQDFKKPVRLKDDGTFSFEGE